MRTLPDPDPVRDPAVAGGAPSAAGQPASPPDRDEEMPRSPLTRGRAIAFGIFVAAALAFLYFVLPQLAGLEQTWNRISDGDPFWLAAALGFELLSFGGYVLLFRTVFVRAGTRVDWRASYEITMAGLAATRLFAAAGAGGVALTAWALRRSGMDARTVAARMVAFMVLLYAVYMGTLVVDGILLRTGVVPGPAPLAFTVVPAALGAVVIGLFLVIALVPADLERRLTRWARPGRHPRLSRWAGRAATVPASAAEGVRTALSLLRSRDLGLLGAPAWWAFDVAVLWACFHAFGQPPPMGVVVMGYFVGMMANTLPLPGGIGGVEGGMIGCFVAFGVPAGLAVVAVLAYRAFAFWLPTIPGAIAYLQLRRTVSRWSQERAGGEAGAAAAVRA